MNYNHYHIPQQAVQFVERRRYNSSGKHHHHRRRLRPRDRRSYMERLQKWLLDNLARCDSGIRCRKVYKWASRTLRLGYEQARELLVQLRDEGHVGLRNRFVVPPTMETSKPAAKADGWIDEALAAGAVAAS